MKDDGSRNYGELIKRYQSLVFGVAFHMLGNVEDARDVAQDVFIRAFTRLDQVRDPARMGAWLRQIAVNECRAWTGRRRPSAPLPEDAQTTDSIRQTDNRLLLEAALRAIDETSRLTVILFYLHAYSLKEIGSFLDEPVTTIKSRLRNARAKLRREMEEILERNLGRDPLPEDFAERVTRLIAAVEASDEPTIRALLDDEPRLLNPEEAPGRHTPLHIASAGGRASVVELLLAYGADPNALDVGDNASPLHYAAERGWLDCVKLLVEAGTDVNWSQNVHERGPLGWAVIFGTVQWEVANYLLAHGARHDLFSAIGMGDIDAVRAIVQADPTALQQRMSRCEEHWTPIEFATSYKQFEIARLLVDLGTVPNLSESAALGMTDRVTELLAGNPELEPALWATVKAGQVETARLLLQAGTNPNAAPQGTSLLFDAIGGNDAAMAKLLIEFGADIEYKDSHWNSPPLGWQVFYGRAEASQLAIDLGATVTANLLELAESGERGELRRWSSGTPEDFRRVHQILSDHFISS